MICLGWGVGDSFPPIPSSRTYFRGFRENRSQIDFSRLSAFSTSTKLKKLEIDENRSQIDYRIKEESGKTWLPFPNLLEHANIRHTWIWVRNERPSIPSFCKAHMPHKRDGDEERNARITMTYVHPFTLTNNCKRRARTTRIALTSRQGELGSRTQYLVRRGSTHTWNS